jgi:biotin transport system substrate-specific component
MVDRFTVAISTELLWALIGLLLTIGGTFLPAAVALPSRDWGHQAIQMHALGITYQFGAGLLVGCVAGKNPATLSQVAYVLLGLTPWFPVFSKGGGLGYLAEPSFGYILGFIPGAWVCGYLAFKAVPKLEVLLVSCLTGLVSIHMTGLAYLGLLRLLGVVSPAEFMQLLTKFSVVALPGQFAVVCAVTILAYGLRRLLFY